MAYADSAAEQYTEQPPTATGLQGGSGGGGSGEEGTGAGASAQPSGSGGGAANPAGRPSSDPSATDQRAAGGAGTSDQTGGKDAALDTAAANAPGTGATPVSQAVESTPTRSSSGEDGGGMGFLPILIGLLLLAAISAGAFVFQQRRSGRIQGPDAVSG